MSTQAYSYIRVSGLGQVDGHGLERQRKAIEEYAASHDLTIVHTFCESGVSGTLADRPQLRQMLDEIAETTVKTVIIERLDRLARDLIVQETIASELRKEGAALISVAEGPELLSDDPTRRFIRQIFGAIADLEKTTLVRKLRLAREAKRAENGKCEGRKAYGHDSDRPGERGTLASMCRMNIVGFSVSYITRQLNARGDRARSGKPWRSDVVRRILKREQEEK